MDTDRFVLDIGPAPAPLDASGFLEIPPADAWWVPADSRPIAADSFVGSDESFVLLAIAGAGKSTVLQQLQAREGDSVAVELRAGDATTIITALDAAIAREGPVYLDSLDEAELRIPGLFRILEQRLSTPRARQTRWRLACRPAAWNPHFARVLGETLPRFRQLELLPLTRESTHRIVGESGVDPSAFLRALTEAHLGRLAATPGRLIAAAAHWRETGTLARDPVEAMEFEVSQLLQEPDPGHPQPPLPVDRRRVIAERLGAMAIFCGLTRFGGADSPSAGAVGVTSLPSEPEPDDIASRVEPADYRALLDTALFGPAPDGTVAFRHQQYSEYLAAAYVVRRRVGPQALRALLGVGDDDLLPGGMAGVTSWLVALAPSSIAHLIAANALQLARTGLEVPHEESRAALTGALLSRSAAGEIDPEWAVALDPLAHGSLEGQIRSSLVNGIRCSEHLWWVARLAVAGSCRELVPDLLEPSMDRRWAPWARGAGVHAIGVLGDNEFRLRLRPLLELDADEDPDDELLADAIEALYPDLLSTNELLRALRPRRNDHLVGGYLMLLGRLAALIPNDELPAALSWLANQVRGSHDRYGRLPDELIRRAWEHSGGDQVLHALGGVLAEAVRTEARFEYRRAPHPWAVADPADRRRLAVAVSARLNGDDGWWSLFELGLVTSDDAMWLVTDLPEVPDAAQPALAACLPQLVSEPSLELADRIYRMPATHPAYRATEWLRTPVSLTSETARRWQRISAEDRADEHQDLDLARQQELLLNALAAAEGDPAEWWKVLYWLSIEAGGTSDALFAHDLRSRPGWALLSNSDQSRVVEVGLRHLRTHSPDPDNWRGRSQITTGTVTGDWGPVYLLTTLAKHEPQRIRDLEAPVWERLSSAIVAAWNFDHGEDRDLRGQVVRLAPPEARSTLIDAALVDLSANAGTDRGLTQPSVYAALMVDIAGTVADAICDRQYSDRQTTELLDLMAERIPPTAVQTAHRLLQEHGTYDHAATILARLDAPSVIAEMASSGGDLRERLLGFVPEVELRELDTDQLTTLAQMVLDTFPISNDPPQPRGVYSPDAGHRTREARNRMLSMLVDRGAVASLERLAHGRTGADFSLLTRLRRQSRARAVDLARQPLTPDQLLTLVGRGDLRLVRSDRDLIEIVIEMLNRLQDEIANGAWRDLWNDSRTTQPEPKREDDISDWVQRHLSILMSTAILDREVQVDRPRGGGIGNRIDLAATAAAGQSPTPLARVGVEAKLIDHPELLTAMATQLVERYLGVMNREHGVYLVYWVTPSQRPESWRSGLPNADTDLMSELRRQADGLLPEFHIRPFLLDISHPA
jgi:hypothetical protein